MIPCQSHKTHNKTCVVVNYGVEIIDAHFQRTRKLSSVSKILLLSTSRIVEYETKFEQKKFNQFDWAVQLWRSLSELTWVCRPVVIPMGRNMLKPLGLLNETHMISSAPPTPSRFISEVNHSSMMSSQQTVFGSVQKEQDLVFFFIDQQPNLPG